MLILIPIALLLLGSLGLALIYWRRPGYGSLWFGAVLFALLSWLSLGYLRFRLPTTFAPGLWKPDVLFTSSPALLLDYSSWPYAFSIATLTLAVILTAPTRMQQRTNLFQLAGNLALGGMGMMAVMAANPLTMLIGWAAIDLIDFFILLRLAETPQLSNRIILSFGGRIAGILFVLWSVVIGSRLSGKVTDFTSIQAEAGLFLLIGVAFRLGVFPLHLSISGESKLRRGMGTILRFVPAASSLVILSRLPANAVPNGLKTPLYALVLLAVIAMLVQIINTKNDLDTRPLWAVMLSSLAVGCVIRGFPASSTAWGVTLVLIGGFLYINPYQSRLLMALSFVAFASVAGIPFLPLAGGWQGLLANAGVFGFAINFIVQCLFLAAVIHLLTIKKENIRDTERLTQLTVPFSLFLILVSYLLAGLWGWPGSRTQGIWAAGIASLVLVTGWMIFHKKILTLLQKIKYYQRSIQFFDGMKPRLAGLVRIETYYNAGEQVFLLAGKLVNLLTGILEGEGGILWAMVLLTLLIALVKQGIK
jgi:hypothetical protein